MNAHLERRAQMEEENRQQVQEKIRVKEESAKVKKEKLQKEQADKMKAQSEKIKVVVGRGRAAKAAAGANASFTVNNATLPPSTSAAAAASSASSSSTTTAAKGIVKKYLKRKSVAPVKAAKKRSPVAVAPIAVVPVNNTGGQHSAADTIAYAKELAKMSADATRANDTVAKELGKGFDTPTNISRAVDKGTDRWYAGNNQ